MATYLEELELLTLRLGEETKELAKIIDSTETIPNNTTPQVHIYNQLETYFNKIVFIQGLMSRKSKESFYVYAWSTASATCPFFIGYGDKDTIIKPHKFDGIKTIMEFYREVRKASFYPYYIEQSISESKAEELSKELQLNINEINKCSFDIKGEPITKEPMSEGIDSAFIPPDLIEEVRPQVIKYIPDFKLPLTHREIVTHMEAIKIATDKKEKARKNAEYQKRHQQLKKHKQTFNVPEFNKPSDEEFLETKFGLFGLH